MQLPYQYTNPVPGCSVTDDVPAIDTTELANRPSPQSPCPWGRIVNANKMVGGGSGFSDSLLLDFLWPRSY